MSDRDEQPRVAGPSDDELAALDRVDDPRDDDELVALDRLDALDPALDIAEIDALLMDNGDKEDDD